MRQVLARLWIALIGLGAASPALAQRYEELHGFWHPASGWGHMLFGGLMMIVFWGGVIALIVLLVRWLGRPDGGGSDGGRRPTPLEILQERYARGEIDREEYEQRRRDLLA